MPTRRTPPITRGNKNKEADRNTSTPSTPTPSTSTPIVVQPGPSPIAPDSNALLQQLLRENTELRHELNRQRTVGVSSVPLTHDSPPLRPTTEPYEDQYGSSQRPYRPRMPDLGELDDGKSPTWTSWKIQATSNFEEYPWNFPTEKSKVRYLFAHTKGQTTKYLEPRMEAGTWNTSGEIFAFLKTIHERVDAVPTARRQYNALTMDTFPNFQSFYQEFLHLSGKGHIAETHLLGDLYDKLSPDLKELMLTKFMEYSSYLELGSDLLVYDERQREIKEVRARARVNRNISAAAKKIALTPTSTGSSLVPRSSPAGPSFSTSTLAVRPSFPSRTTSPRATTAPPVPLSRSTPAPQDSVTCFNCGESGHYAKDCSKPKRLTHSINDLEPDPTDTTPAADSYDIERELEELKDTT
jgi:Zinc knuckle